MSFAQNKRFLLPFRAPEIDETPCCSLLAVIDKGQDRNVTGKIGTFTRAKRFSLISLLSLYMLAILQRLYFRRPPAARKYAFPSFSSISITITNEVVNFNHGDNARFFC